MWRTKEYPVHGMTPSIFQLAIHLPGQYVVAFDSMIPQDELILAIDRQHSTLMAFSDYNAAHPEAGPCLYQDFPLHFTWDARHRCLKPRIRSQIQIGRM